MAGANSVIDLSNKARQRCRTRETVRKTRADEHGGDLKPARMGSWT